MDNALHEKWSFAPCYNSEMNWSHSLFERDNSMCMCKDAIQGFLLLIICFKFLLYRIYCSVTSTSIICSHRFFIFREDTCFPWMQKNHTSIL